MRHDQFSLLPFQRRMRLHEMAVCRLDIDAQVLALKDANPGATRPASLHLKIRSRRATPLRRRETSFPLTGLCGLLRLITCN
jgi:hypothetical protein